MIVINNCGISSGIEQDSFVQLQSEKEPTLRYIARHSCLLNKLIINRNEERFD
jgi:hypothetical protein